MEFVKVDFDNNKVSNANLSEHREIIEKYVNDGYDYLGFVPVKLGPSGKILSIELIFNKNNG